MEVVSIREVVIGYVRYCIMGYASGGLAILWSARRSAQVVSGLRVWLYSYGIWDNDAPQTCRLSGVYIQNIS